MAQDNNRRLKRRVRNSYIISTVSISLVLFILGAVYYLILNAFAATDSLKESFTMNVMLRSTVEQKEAEAIGKKIEAIQGIKSVRFVPKEKAAEEFKEYIGSDFVGFLEFNPLPDAFEVGLDADFSEQKQVTLIEKRITAIVGVEEIVFQRTIVDQLNSNIQKFNIILGLFGATLLIISVILLNNTIRVSIYSKRYIINTMKLVGATQWFIIKPFFYSALRQGFYAALIAGVMFVVMVAGINESLPEVLFVSGTMQIAQIILVMVLGGIAISVTFTTLGVNKFIRNGSSHIHFY